MHIGYKLVRALWVFRSKIAHKCTKCQTEVVTLIFFFPLFSFYLRHEESLLECIAKLRPQTLRKYSYGKVVHVKIWNQKGTAVCFFLLSMSSSNSRIIATFTFEVFLHIIECIVTVQQMVECITLHMGSANNCYSEVFLDGLFLLFSFCISSFNMDNVFHKWSHLWWECWQGPK